MPYSLLQNLCVCIYNNIKKKGEKVNLEQTLIMSSPMEFRFKPVPLLILFNKKISAQKSDFSMFCDFADSF